MLHVKLLPCEGEVARSAETEGLFALWVYYVALKGFLEMDVK